MVCTNPSEAAETIKQIQFLHKTIIYNLLINEAWQAAPKPLSIFTTLTPLAQLFSIASKADNP